MSDIYFGIPVLQELDQLHRTLELMFAGNASSVRAPRPGSFPALNVGSTDQSIEVVAFLPGVDAKTIELTIDKGVLSLSGERTTPEPAGEARSYARERFSGRFQRVIELPQTVDPTRVEAHYSEGCLKVTIAKKQSSTPKAISVQ